MSEDFIGLGHLPSEAHLLALRDIARKLEQGGKPYSHYSTMPDIGDIDQEFTEPDRNVARQDSEQGYKILNDDQIIVVDAILRTLGIEPPSGTKFD